MAETDDREFYRRREREERSLAERSLDPAVAASRRRMADEYAKLTETSSSRPPRGRSPAQRCGLG